MMFELLSHWRNNYSRKNMLGDKESAAPSNTISSYPR
jgi:hypothetical protein